MYRNGLLFRSASLGLSICCAALFSCAAGSGSAQTLTPANSLPAAKDIDAEGAPFAPADISGLPAIPEDRSGAGITDYVLLGVDAESHSASAAPLETSLLLPDAGDMAWAIWRFKPHGGLLDGLDVMLGDTVNASAWVGLADFSSGKWDFSGPYSDSAQMDVQRNLHVSPGGSVHVAIVSCGSLVEVDALALRALSSNGQPPAAQLSASVNKGNTPLAVELDASGSVDHFGAVTHYLWDFEGDGVYEGQSEEPVISHVYENGGHFNPTVAAVDNDGDRGYAGAEVAVNSSPVAMLHAQASECMSGDLLEFDASLSIDPEGGELHYEWDLDGNGSFEHSPAEQEFSGEQRAIASRTQLGVWQVSVRVSDSQGAAAAAAATVVIHGFATRYIVSADIKAAGVSLAEVHGNPAVSYQDRAKKEVRYARSSSPSGEQVGDWESVRIDRVETDAQLETELRMFGEQPSAAFPKPQSGAVVYARSGGRDGLIEWAWDSIEIDAGNAGLSELSMQRIDGRPALAYRRQSDNSLCYVISSTIDGRLAGDWPEPISIASAEPYTIALAEINGRPAAIFRQASGLMYAHSSSRAGDELADWAIVPLGVQDVIYAALAEHENKPAAFLSHVWLSAAGYMYSSSGSGADSSDWHQAPLVSDDTFGVVSLIVADEEVWVCFQREDGRELVFASATDPRSGGDWLEVPVASEAVIPFKQPSLASIGGMPAVAYISAGRVKYAVFE